MFEKYACLGKTLEERGEEYLEKVKNSIKKVVSEIRSVNIVEKPFAEQINGMVSML